MSKVDNVWANKLQKSYVMALNGDAIFKENGLLVWKMTEKNLINSEKLHSDGLVLSKAYRVLEKKYRRVMFHDT